jgi:hypothetical protein
MFNMFLGDLVEQTYPGDFADVSHWLSDSLVSVS